MSFLLRTSVSFLLSAVGELVYESVNSTELCSCSHLAAGRAAACLIQALR